MKKTAKPDERDAKILELTNDLQRTRADFENFRKQVEVQRTQAAESAGLATVNKLLPLIDDISRGIAVSPELAPVAKTLEKSLNELQLQRINAGVGVDFNPDFHDAVSMEDGEGEREVIAEELRPGYLYQGQVLRPSMVRVKRA